MFLLYILGIFLILAVVVLLLPVNLNLLYDGDFEYKLKVAFVTLNLDKSEKPKQKNKISNTPKKTEQKKEKSFFEKLTDKKGFVVAVKEIFAFVKDCTVPLKRFLKFVKLKDICLFIAVAGDDAAQTATNYGLVCSAVYPTLSFVEGFVNLQYKSVDVKADFENKKSNVTFSLKIKASVIFILIFAVRIYKEYKNFCIRNEF